LYALDHLTSRSDNGTDLVFVDHDALDPWCVWFVIRIWFVDGFVHLTQDMCPAFAGLFKGLFQHFPPESVDLDIHLAGGDTIGGTYYLEVHVSEVVFITQDIRQDAVFSGSLVADKTHGHTADAAFNLDTGIH